MKLIKPYTRIHIPFISKELNIDVIDVESLLVSCILDKYVKVLSIFILIYVSRFISNQSFFFFSTIQGRIDQVNQVLELDQESTCGARYQALDKWTKQLGALHRAIVSKMA